MELITLKKEHNLLLKDNITEYLNPNFIYLPINKNSEFKIKSKEYIYKGQTLIDLIASPISGDVLGIKKFNNKHYLVIKNDFKEKTKTTAHVRKNLNKITKEELLELLKSFDLNLYDKFSKNYNRIIVNGIEEHPYIGNFIYINKDYHKEILEMIDGLCAILDITDVEIVVKDTDYKSINILNSIIGTDPNIRVKLLPDKYLISKENILKQYMSIKDDFLYLNVEELYDLYNYLKRKRKKEDKLLTITGNAIENPQVIKCKVGTNLKEIIKKYIKITDENNVILINSLLNNNIVDSTDFIITDDIRAIFIMSKIDKKEQKCIRCGKCNEVCPVKVNVFNLVNNKKCNKEDCINCGLCTYICPSYINISKYLEGDKNE